MDLPDKRIILISKVVAAYNIKLTRFNVLIAIKHRLAKINIFLFIKVLKKVFENNIQSMHIILFLCVGLILSQKYKDVNNRISCSRTFVVLQSDIRYSYVNSTPSCQEYPYVMEYAATTYEWPYTAMGMNIGNNYFANFFILDSILEYTERNNVPGFQLLGDTTNQEVSYQASSRTKYTKFSAVSYTREQFTDTTIHYFSYKLDKSDIDIAEVNVNVVFVTNELSLEQQGTSGSRMILKPNSLKWSLNFKNITYSSPTSTGIAVQFKMLAKDTVNMRSLNITGYNKPVPDFKPDTLNQYQNIFDVPFDVGGPNVSYVSYINSADSKKNNVTMQTPIYSDYLFTARQNIYVPHLPSNFLVSAYWFSTSDRLTETNIDIYMSPVSSSSVIKMGWMLMIIILM